MEIPQTINKTTPQKSHNSKNPKHQHNPSIINCRFGEKIQDMVNKC
jgi:hypothetical protein